MALNDIVASLPSVRTCSLLSHRAGSPAEHPRLRKLLSHLESHPSHQLTTAAAARIACFQENYFCGWFKRLTGHTFSSWQRAWRIANIASILLSEDISVARAAERYGYVNMRTFERAFKAQYQTTAREFRRRHEAWCKGRSDGCVPAHPAQSVIPGYATPPEPRDDQDAAGCSGGCGLSDADAQPGYGCMDEPGDSAGIR